MENLNLMILSDLDRFWASPLLIIVGNYGFGLNVREKYMFIGLAVIDIVGYTFFLVFVFKYLAVHNISTNQLCFAGLDKPV
jgi:hypothetical protein